MNERKNLRQMDDFEIAEPMSHAEALQLNAVELYVMKDLSADQELRFEAHYFECRECAKAVAVEQMLTSAMPAKPKPEPWWRRFMIPVLVPVTAALIGLVAFQNLYSIPSLKDEVAKLEAPQPNTVIVARQVEMGSDKTELIKTPSVSVEMILPPGAASPFYRVEFVGGGREPISQVVPAPTGSRLSLHLLRDTLGHGSYDVMVYQLTQQDSREGAIIGQFHFTIQ